MKKVIFYVFTFILSTVQTDVFGKEHMAEEVAFLSHGDKLSGTIIFPDSRTARSAVVFVHGSGRQERNLQLAHQFAAKGIAALVYDKRGVGLSAGVYEEKQSVSGRNIQLLADDALSALNVLHGHHRLKDIPIGFAGISQAGWIIPLAAEKSRFVDFMAIWSGPICKVSEEDIYSKYTSDKDGKIVPTYTEALRARKQAYVWPKFLGVDSDPSESLKNLDIPGIWIFGGKDGSIPVDLSIQRLKEQMDNRGQYEYVFFSNIGHNNMSETFSTVADWIIRLSR